MQTHAQTHIPCYVSTPIALLYDFKGQVTFTYRIRGKNTIFSQKKEDTCTKKRKWQKLAVAVFSKKVICFKDCSLTLVQTLIDWRKDTCW